MSRIVSLLPIDKWAHLLVGIIASVVMALILWQIGASIILATCGGIIASVMLGGWKEIADLTGKGMAEMADLGWTTAGGVIGGLGFAVALFFL